MSSSISEYSNPKNVAECENCNKRIQFYQEEICNTGEKIPCDPDGNLHQCHSKLAYNELRCYFQSYIQQCSESEPNHIQISESGTQIIQAINEPKVQIRDSLGDASQGLDYLFLQGEKNQNKGGV